MTLFMTAILGQLNFNLGHWNARLTGPDAAFPRYLPPDVSLGCLPFTRIDSLIFTAARGLHLPDSMTRDAYTSYENGITVIKELTSHWACDLLKRSQQHSVPQMTLVQMRIRIHRIVIQLQVRPLNLHPNSCSPCSHWKRTRLTFPANNSCELLQKRVLRFKIKQTIIDRFYFFQVTSVYVWISMCIISDVYTHDWISDLRKKFALWNENFFPGTQKYYSQTWEVRTLFTIPVGVVSLFLRFVVFCACICHWLALACGDANSQLKYMVTVEELLVQFFGRTPCVKKATYLKMQPSLKNLHLPEGQRKQQQIGRKLQRACRICWLSTRPGKTVLGLKFESDKESECDRNTLAEYLHSVYYNQFKIKHSARDAILNCVNKHGTPNLPETTRTLLCTEPNVDTGTKVLNRLYPFHSHISMVKQLKFCLLLLQHCSKKQVVAVLESDEEISDHGWS